MCASHRADKFYLPGPRRVETGGLVGAEVEGVRRAEVDLDRGLLGEEAALSDARAVGPRRDGRGAGRLVELALGDGVVEEEGLELEVGDGDRREDVALAEEAESARVEIRREGLGRDADGAVEGVAGDGRGVGVGEGRRRRGVGGPSEAQDDGVAEREEPVGPRPVGGLGDLLDGAVERLERAALARREGRALEAAAVGPPRVGVELAAEDDDDRRARRACVEIKLFNHTSNFIESEWTCKQNSSKLRDLDQRGTVVQKSAKSTSI